MAACTRSTRQLRVQLSRADDRADEEIATAEPEGCSSRCEAHHGTEDELATTKGARPARVDGGAKRGRWRSHVLTSITGPAPAGPLVLSAAPHVRRARRGVLVSLGGPAPLTPALASPAPHRAASPALAVMRGGKNKAAAEGC